jgi:predicted PurR-regulated permease PerM
LHRGGGKEKAVELDKRNVKKILLIITFAVGLYTIVQNLGVVFGAVVSIWSVLSTVITGFGIAFVLNILLRILEKGVFRFMNESTKPLVRRLRRPLCLLLTILLALGFMIVIGLVIIPQVLNTFLNLLNKFPGYINTAVLWIEEKFNSLNFLSLGLPSLSIDWEKTFTSLSDAITSGSSSLISAATTLTASIVNSAISVIFSLIIAVYVLAQKESISRFTQQMMRAFLPDKFTEQILRIARISDMMFSDFIAGQLLDSTILGILCYFGMLIFRFPYPEVIAVLIGITSLVPMVGSFIGLMLGAFLILFISPLKALLFIIFVLALQQLEGSFIYPRVVGRSVGVPGVLVLCSVIVGGNIFGVPGALFGVPVMAVLYTLVREAVDWRLSKRTLREKSRSSQTSEVS